MSSNTYMPTKFKSFRVHKSPKKGINFIYTTNQYNYITASSYGQVNWRNIEAGRRFLTRQHGKAKTIIFVRLTQALTKKNDKSRMGGGKGKNLRGWTGFIRPGSLLYRTQRPPLQIFIEHKKIEIRKKKRFPLEKIKQKFHFPVAIFDAKPYVQNEIFRKKSFSYKKFL